MRAAAVQLNSNADRDRNLEVAERLVRQAAADGAGLIVLPEKWTLLGSTEELRSGAEPIDGPAITAARSWARELGVHLLAGSFAERLEGAERLANTSLLIDPAGVIAATYRKIHMFDVDLGGVAYRESEAESPGEEIVVAEMGEFRLGMSVCYDLRFPELYRILALRGAQVVAVPSAFTSETGREHWEILLRARAIENQSFVIAANQSGTTPPHYDSYGHSMIVDPWGRVLAAIEAGEGIAAVELDLRELERVRAELPSLANRRPSAYLWPEGMLRAAPATAGAA
ncbi:MAG: carbon-nitrogen hydrolase family protein [Solirubrobacterales bacterium]